MKWNLVNFTITQNEMKRDEMREKTSIEEFAVFGGTPAFDDPLYVGRPNIGDRNRLMNRFNEILDRRWLTNNGLYVREFEHKVAELLGVKHCIAMNNGTTALEITTRALGLKGEVIVPSFTFIATAHSLQWQEITPVFCDIDPQTHTIDPDLIEGMITPRTTAIIGVHLWGRPCNISALEKIAERRNLKLIFDAAHAFGVSYKGRMIGNFGDAEILSFHATKFINTLEGGAVVTNDDNIATKLRLMKNFGFTGYDKVIYIGINGKMNEMSAAMGITGIESLDDFVTANYQNYKTYQNELHGVPGVQLLSYNEREKNNYQYIILEIDDHTIGITRDQLIEILHAEKVLARRYFYPGCHQMEPYKSFFPHAGLLLQNTERLSQRVLALPTGSSVSPDEIKTICRIVRLAIENGREVCARMKDNGKLAVLDRQQATRTNVDSVRALQA
jgi:dTDP-4-amino-4,6-dideoxygalactose transaminase